MKGNHAVPADSSIDRFFARAKLRRLIERDYQDLKQDLDLGHHVGYGRPGFRQHGALVKAAYVFLIAVGDSVQTGFALADTRVQTAVHWDHRAGDVGRLIGG